jgi:hypothetical protein
MSGERRDSVLNRRALVVGAAAAGLAVAARPLSIRAASDQSLHTGLNSVDEQTSIARTDSSSFVTLADDDAAVGARMSDTNKVAVDAGFSGTDGTAVSAWTNGNSSNVAVFADTTSGVGEGISVKAKTKNGVGVWAECTGGEAIHVIGVTHFSRSGSASFASGASSKTISGYRIASDTLVVATIQGDVAGTWVRGVTVNVPGQNFTIRLNKAAPKALKVGWFIVN